MAQGRIRRLVTRPLRWVWVPIVSFVVVVAVAMACAVWSPIRDSAPDILDGTFLPPHEKPRSLLGYEGHFTFGFERIGLGLSIVPILSRESHMVAGEEVRSSRLIIVGRSGLPFLCMRWTNADASRVDQSLTMAGGIRAPGTLGIGQLPRRIPLMPEPVGMTLNVLIYSAAIVLVRLTWRRAVVLRRKRRNLCLECAYPVDDLAICPECGKPTECEA